MKKVITQRRKDAGTIKNVKLEIRNDKLERGGIIKRKTGK